MPIPVLFGISVAFGLAAWGAVTRQYIWPALRQLPTPESLKPILLLNGFRFLGLAFIVPGVVSPELPASFAQPVAYGVLYPGGLRASSSHNAWPDVSNTAANEVSRSDVRQTEYRLMPRGFSMQVFVISQSPPAPRWTLR
jgi:hypothetical protein